MAVDDLISEVCVKDDVDSALEVVSYLNEYVNRHPLIESILNANDGAMWSACIYKAEFAVALEYAFSDSWQIVPNLAAAVAEAVYAYVTPYIRRGEYMCYKKYFDLRPSYPIAKNIGAVVDITNDGDVIGSESEILDRFKTLRDFGIEVGTRVSYLGKEYLVVGVTSSCMVQLNSTDDHGIDPERLMPLEDDMV